ncbi:MAG: response regulator transcription factor [Butyribacter sp.]|nr:response regulator transcription factor [Butyribacter sp.]
MNTVFIADDELIIRQGLKCIIEWEELGFQIIGEAANGEDALHFITDNNPDVVMLDIRMPKITGLDVVKKIRQNGYRGKVIILSGYSDFKYAQAAIRYGVEYYLTKPIDEQELLETVQEIGQILQAEAEQRNTLDRYRDQARSIILCDILAGNAILAPFDLAELNLDATKYQVVIYEKYSHHAADMSYRFADLLKVTNEDNSSYENITIDNNEILLLKGDFIIQKFFEFLEHYEREQKPQTNSPLDSLFITYGRIVTSIDEVHTSYNEALRLLQRRFFCENKQHTIGYNELPEVAHKETYELNAEALQDYCERLIGFIQAAKRNQVAETLCELEQNLYYASVTIPEIKLFLTDLYLSIKEKISHLYHNENIPFPGNTEIISCIGEKYYLYEIILFFTEQFEMIMRSIGNPSSNGVMDDIINYIEHNYMNNIKLENIAPLFGYNSSYLGKIFNKKAGMGFNMFIDQVRIKHSKELLANTDLKVYEIAEKVGYRNVDYFHTKFKKYVNQSPAEYRKYTKGDAAE